MDLVPVKVYKYIEKHSIGRGKGLEVVKRMMSGVRSVALFFRSKVLLRTYPGSLEPSVIEPRDGSNSELESTSGCCERGSGKCSHSIYSVRRMHTSEQ